MSNYFLLFIRIGFFCASYPILVICLSILLCSMQTCGLYYFSVMTEPIDLWSPVDSKTRQNKIYYDTHFRPFYRTTQLIIRPTNTTPWLHKLDFQEDSVEYSSALRLDFLHEVLSLQNNIPSLTATVYCDYSLNDVKCDFDHTAVVGGQATQVNLKDICFQPLYPDNDNCTIQTVLNYWQNSHVNLDFSDWMTGDYITQ